MDVMALARALAEAIKEAAAHNAQPNIEKKAKPEEQEQPRVHELTANGWSAVPQLSKAQQLRRRGIELEPRGRCWQEIGT